MNTSHAPGPRVNDRRLTPTTETRQAARWFIRYVTDRAKRGIPTEGRKAMA